MTSNKDEPRFAPALRGYDRQQVDDYVRATQVISMPLCTGESNYLKDEVLNLLQSRAARA